MNFPALMLYGCPALGITDGNCTCADEAVPDDSVAETEDHEEEVLQL